MLLVWPLTAVLLAAHSQAQDSVRGEERTTLSREQSVGAGSMRTQELPDWEETFSQPADPASYAQYH